MRRLSRPPHSLVPTLILLLAIATASAQTAAPGHAHTWKTYRNARFDYALCYPADLLVPQGEADNGDGQMFLAKDGTKLTVFGANNALFRSLSEELDSEWADEAGKITYKVVKPTWAVESGQKGQNIFYGKILFVHDQFKIVTIVYPADQSQVYKPIVGELASCFTSTTPLR